MTEFELIRRYFAAFPGVQHQDVVLGIGDDAAIITPPKNQQWVSSIDTCVVGTHFFAQDRPQDVGYKSLAAALSDLAAMGAKPAWVLLSLTMPQIVPDWVAGFCQGFRALLEAHQLMLVGGDCSQGPLSITWQVNGWVPAGKAVTRRGAQIGDVIGITGTQWGAPGLAVQALKQHLTLSPEDVHVVCQALYAPQPRIAEGMALRGLAHAMIDVSDGLVGDLMHLLSQGLGAEIDLQAIPLSPIIRKYLSTEDAYRLALTAGDDYELCFTMTEEQRKRLTMPHHKIGTVVQQPGVRLWLNPQELLTLEATHYVHFR